MLFGRARRWRPRRRRQRDETTTLKIRLNGLRLVILLLCALLLGQLWRMQVVEGARYRQRAEHNRLRILPIPAPRGIIYDRNGQPLVRNVPSFMVAIVPADLPEKEEAGVVQRLAGLIEMPAAEITAKVAQQRAERRLFAPVPIMSNVPQEVAFRVEEHHRELPGVVLVIEPKRQYLAGSVTAHLVGYVGAISPQDYERLQAQGYQLDDKVGKTGVEAAFERELRGQPGQEQVEINVYGRKVRTLAQRAPELGKNLVLTIDLDLQRAMARYLAESLGDSDYAAAIAMNPQTGEVLGLVSLPSYNPNLFSGPVEEEELAALLNDPRRPLFNYAIGGAHPPGSTFKLVVGAAALEEGIAHPGTEIVSKGSIVIASPYDPAAVTVMRDWAPLGRLNFYQAIARSSDVYFYYLSGGYEDFPGLGPERLARYARYFGLGERTGIKLPGETDGLVPDPHWKEGALQEPWYLGDTYNYGIGQGYLLASPLQMLSVTAAIANGGRLLRPQLVKEVRDSQGRVVASFKPEVVRELPVQRDNLEVIREGMRQAVEWGTATQAQVSGVEIAGKTGTAEFGAIDPRTGQRSTHGWFVAFAPFDDPEIAVVVFQQHGGGSQTAAPVAQKILRFYLEKRGLVPPQALTAAPGTRD